MAIRLQVVFLLIACLSVLAGFFPQIADTYLIFEGNKVLDGEIWRIFTSHFCHTNLPHLVMNLLALALLMSLFNEVYGVTLFLCVFILAAVAIGLGYVLFYPPDTRYLGLSGVLHAVASAGAIMSLNVRRLFSIVFLLGLISKLLYEYTAGASESLAEMIQARVAIEAHLVGALVGVLFGSALLTHKKTHQKRPL